MSCVQSLRDGLKFVVSPSVCYEPSGWLGSKHQLVNQRFAKEKSLLRHVIRLYQVEPKLTGGGGLHWNCLRMCVHYLMDAWHLFICLNCWKLLQPSLVCLFIITRWNINVSKMFSLLSWSLSHSARVGFRSLQTETDLYLFKPDLVY